MGLPFFKRWCCSDVSVLDFTKPQLAVALGCKDQILDGIVHDPVDTLHLTRLIGRGN